MITDERDCERIVQLAREGKKISNIWEDDFSNYDYWDIYEVIYGAGERSAVGAKRMITNRLNKLPDLSKAEQKEMINEIDDLVCYLYTRYKESQRKLNGIRNIMDNKNF